MEQLIAVIVIPLVGALVTYVLQDRPNTREAATLIIAGLLIATVASLHNTLLGKGEITVTLLSPFQGINIALHLEPLGLLFAMVASGLWLVTSIYSIGYMRGHGEANQTRFYIYFAIAISGAMGVAFAANLFTLFVFYEVLTLSTFPLVTHSGTDEAKRAGRVYLGILIGTSIAFFLLAIAWTWLAAGRADFAVGGILADKVSSPAAGILLVLYVFGIGKAAIMPFHRWLPAAMVAPTPVSALLHAVAVVKAGVFAILKIMIYVFGLDLLSDITVRSGLLYLAAATILIASIVAMRKDNLKARLAYSTISQLSYVILGALLANELGIIGGGMHIAMHAFGKITLFFCAGAILVASHKTEVSQLDGIARQMPVTMTAFFIGSLSIIGLPPAGGLWSKWYLALGTLEAGQLVLLAVLMLSSLLNVYYLLSIPMRALFPQPSTGLSDTSAEVSIKEAPWPCLLAMAITSIGCIILFFWPEPIYKLLLPIVAP